LVGEHDPGRRERRRRRGGAFDGLGVKSIVGGGEQHEIAADELEPGIAGGVYAAIFPMGVNPQPRHARRRRLQPREAIVCRAVIDHDDFRRRQRLL